MDILMYKDGHLSISESPLQGKENNLDDVVMLITNPQEGESLTYKGGKWVNGESGFSPDITSPQDGDTLVYDATAQKWVNGAGGGGGVLKLVEGETTWQQVYDALAAGTPVVVPYIEDGAHVYCDYGYAAIANAENYGVYLVGANMSTDAPNYIAETPDSALIYNEGD